MFFSSKVMFLGLETHKKDDNIYNFLKILDKTTNESLMFFINQPQKFKDVKPYSDIDLTFNIDKRVNKETGRIFYNLNLVEE